MISHWSLSDSKSLQVPWILLNILADLNNAVVWMISTGPLISKSSSPCTNPLVIYQEHQLQLVSPSLLCSSVFSIPLHGSGTYPSFRFLLILLSDQPGQQMLYNLVMSVIIIQIQIRKQADSVV